MAGIVFSFRPAPPADVVVLGGGLIAPGLLTRLDEAGHAVTHIARFASPDDARAGAVTLDLLQNGHWRAPAGSIIVSLLPLWGLTPMLPGLGDASRIIAFGSTTLFTKAGSEPGLGGDRAAALAEGERAVRDFCAGAGPSWTILRPTMIYAPPRDGTVTELARAIRRWPILPLAGRARGLRQPVHADDLAAAVLAVMGSGATWDRAFNLGGGETLTFRAMARRIARALGRPALFPAVPAPLLRRARALVAGQRDKARGFSIGAIEHMNQDMAFDNAPASRAFAYRPRPFTPEFPPDFR